MLAGRATGVTAFSSSATAVVDVAVGTALDIEAAPGAFIELEFTTVGTATFDTGSEPGPARGSVVAAADLVVFNFANLARYSSLVAGGAGFAITLRSTGATGCERVGAIVFGCVCPPGSNGAA